MLNQFFNKPYVFDRYSLQHKKRNPCQISVIGIARSETMFWFKKLALAIFNIFTIDDGGKGSWERSATCHWHPLTLIIIV